MNLAPSPGSVFLAAWLALASGAASAAPMTFRLLAVGDSPACGRACPQIIVADGEITERTPSEFAAFVKSQAVNRNARGVVLINSHGGRVGASVALGRMFRAAEAAVIVGRVGPQGVINGRCYSACVYALMGAKKRVIPRESRVGIHRMFAYDAAGVGPDDLGRTSRVYATPDLVARLGEYAASMGVSRELVYAAESVSPERVRIITPQEMRRWRLGVEKF